MAFVIDFLESNDKDSIVTELRRIAALLGKRSISVEEINEHGRVHSATITKKFGSMRKAHEAAGLIALRYTKPTDAELLKAIADLWTITLRESGRRPRQHEVQQYGCPVSLLPIKTRFGTWKKALVATAKAYAMGAPASPPDPPKARPKKKRQPVSERKRFHVLKRDGYTCRICRKAGGELEVDHILPVSRGGSNKPENLQTLCKPCNRGKSNSLQ
jgi:5-methylcytosine-specific restriction endonuclease McrA